MSILNASIHSCNKERYNLGLDRDIRCIFTKSGPHAVLLATFKHQEIETSYDKATADHPRPGRRKGYKA